jgi:hypothetical protein
MNVLQLSSDANKCVGRKSKVTGEQTVKTFGSSTSIFSLCPGDDTTSVLELSKTMSDQDCSDRKRDFDREPGRSLPE